MGLYLDETTGDRFIDGVTEGRAVQRKDSNALELWDEDCEVMLGRVPGGMTPVQINAVIRLYYRGRDDGIQIGEKRKQAEIRAVLGL